MEIFACGLNAHGQLILRRDCANVTTFQKMAEGHRAVVLSACWCATLLYIDGHLHYRGYYEARPSDYLVTCPEGTIMSAFGDHQGIRGALTAEGSLLELVRHSPRSDALLFQNPSQSWTWTKGCSLEHVALAANGQIAVVARTSACLPLASHMFEKSASQFRRISFSDNKRSMQSILFSIVIYIFFTQVLSFQDRC